ncbi:DUF2231 domain-containing protein [Nocardia stercoris]|uniref:DUF2231 domain-containing protein n=1 Tax=Nocardia stercoris TaxID=2483361 RepID=A0A3M2L831_9NOCA|nr:DUF2231 domain-containing protein [Nocardia stercoris]RMI33534.1 hypothetical protein EBN03_10490 [Nocardia stercoris]
MGPVTFNGLPAHVLLVHFVVVLVPLAALLLMVAVCWPAAQRRLGVVSPLAAFVALVCVPLTTHSGEWLEDQLPHDPMIRTHAHLGDDLLVWSLATFLLATAWWAIRSETARAALSSRVPVAAGLAGRRAVVAVVAVLSVVVAAGSMVQVYRIGDSGAKAAWHDQISATAPNGR